MVFLLEYKEYWLFTFFITAGFLLGFIFNKIIINQLKTITHSTSWKIDDILLDIVGKYIRIWIIIGGFFLAIDTLPPFLIKLSDSIHKVLLVFFVLSIAFAIANLITALIKNYYTSQTGVHNTELASYLIKGLIITLAGIMLLQTFGISVTPILGALGVGSLAIGLALKDTLTNLFGGIQILLTNQLKTGDFIQLQSGREGTIKDITLRNTTLLDRSNNTIVVPNSELSIATIVNYSMPSTILRVKVDCGVGYNSDLEMVERLVLETAKEVIENTEDGFKGFSPRMRFHKFNDFSIDFTVIMRSKSFPGTHRLRHNFIKLIKKRFDENNIEIPFPIRTLINKS
mgnify:CR=1 FL=1